MKMNILFFTLLFHTNLPRSEEQVANLVSVVMELGFRRLWVLTSFLLHLSHVSWDLFFNPAESQSISCHIRRNIYSYAYKCSSILKTKR